MYRHEDSLAVRPEVFFAGEVGSVRIGKTQSGSTVSLPVDAMDSHILILGKTGMGKSTVLNSLCEGIISSKMGNVVLIDPHETLSRRLLSKVEKDRIYALSTAVETVGDLKKSIQFNVLRGVGTVHNRDVISGWIRDLFFHEEVFSGGTWGPRLEVVFRVLLSDYMEVVSDPSLKNFLQVISSVENIRDYLRKTKNRTLSAYFTDLASNQKAWLEYISSTVNKLLPIVSNSTIQDLINGENENRLLNDFMEQGSGFIPIMMDKMTLSEETYRIASILMLSVIFNILRSSDSSGKIVKTYIMIDEAQSIPAGIMLRLLNEGRKYGIRLILSTQHLRGLSTEIARSVLANVGTFISFSISGDDAQTISDNIFPFPSSRRIAEIMKAQGKHNALVWNLAANGQSGPLSFRTSPLESIERDVSGEIVRECVLKYGSMVRENRETQASSLHQGILEVFKDLIIKNGIVWEDSKRVSGHVPDGMFLHSGTQYLVEVENSDLLHKFRMLEKVSTYSGRQIIFICRQGGGRTAMEMIRRPTFVGEKSGLLLEVPVINAEKKIYFRDLGDFLNNVIILEFNGKGFSQVFHNKSTRFSITRLSNRFGANNYIPSDKFLSVRVKLYEIMVRTGVPFISYSGLTKYKDLNPTYMKEFFDSIGKETITYTDLFLPL